MCSNPNASIFRRPRTSCVVRLMIPPDTNIPLASTFSPEDVQAERGERVDREAGVGFYVFSSPAHL